MKLTTVCPACSSELPDGYAFDHVAIDLALTDQAALFATMTRAERTETVMTGLRRGLTIAQLATRLRVDRSTIQRLLPADHPDATARRNKTRVADQAALEARVRELWQQNKPDTEIALSTGHSVYVIARIRRTLGLPTLQQPRRRVFTGGA